MLINKFVVSYKSKRLTKLQQNLLNDKKNAVFLENLANICGEFGTKKHFLDYKRQNETTYFRVCSG